MVQYFYFLLLLNLWFNTSILHTISINTIFILYQRLHNTLAFTFWPYTHCFLLPHKVYRQATQSKFELMDLLAFLLILPFVWACIHVLTSCLICQKSGLPKLPPGPDPFPIIENILELGNMKVNEKCRKPEKV